jgi:hypothetical protein
VRGSEGLAWHLNSVTTFRLVGAIVASGIGLLILSKAPWIASIPRKYPQIYPAIQIP